MFKAGFSKSFQDQIKKATYIKVRRSLHHIIIHLDLTRDGPQFRMSWGSGKQTVLLHPHPSLSLYYYYY
jgi:hypothetical protein